MPQKDKRIFVVGAGPAGMIAAARTAESGARVTLVDKNEKTGKKLYITGKGRCNVTNACDIEDFFENIAHNPSFCYSAVYTFTPTDTVSLIEKNGTPLKCERGNRVFPVSDKASDIIKALERNMHGVELMLKTRLDDVICAENRVTGIKLNGRVYPADAVILALGGASYVSTGSDGKWKEKIEALGIGVKDFSPALVPLKSDAKWVHGLTGLSLKNVKLKAKAGNRTVFEDMGEMLFTHFGISGPLVLTLSSLLNKSDFNKLSVTVDLKPALSIEQLDARVLRDFAKNGAKTLKNACAELLPARLISAVIENARLNGEKQVSQISAQEREALVKTLKSLAVPVTGFGEINEAIVTRGGVDTKEIDPSTMESKKISGLYFAGEMIDIDAFTGGFNIQLALSTGFLAGSAAGGIL